MPDLWWHLGETTGDRAAVKLARPFAFSTVAVDWYVYPGLEGAPCRNAVTIMSQGRALAELRPAATCGALHEGGRPMYVEATVVTLPRPERVTELQLVHSAAPGPATSPDAGYATVRGLTLSVSPEPARPEVQSATGDVHLPLEGRGAHRWVIEETGLFVVPPGGAPVPVRLPASFAKAEGGITPVRLGDTGWYAAAAMAPVGNEGPVTHELVVFDTAAPGPSRLAMTFAHPIGDVWFDDCAQTLRVELEGGPTARLPVARLIAGPGGTASPAAPGAPAPAPETKL